MKNIKVNDVISFYTCCNADRKRITGVVEYKDQLGFITVISGMQYELKKLIDIEVETEFIELERQAINEVRVYSDSVIMFLDSPIAHNHLFAVRGEVCDFYECNKYVMVYLKPNYKTLNLKTDLPYLARLSKSFEEFCEYWIKETEKLNRLATDVFYKFHNECKEILDTMNKTDKKHFFNYHTN